MNNATRWLVVGCIAAVVSGRAFADAVPEWKKYENDFLGVRLEVKPAWTEVFFKETKQMGALSFTVSQDPKGVLAISRIGAEGMPFDMWVSSEVLHQIFQPGYQAPVRMSFAGRPSYKVIGRSLNKPERRQEIYFSSHPPYIDQINFSAPNDEWETVEPSFAALRKSIHWTR